MWRSVSSPGKRRLQISSGHSAIFRRHYHFHNTLLEELHDRGLVFQLTESKHLEADLAEKRRYVYLGVDPTAPSLHVGHLLPFMCLLHFQLRGHKPIALIGGATALIGDPSGKSTERNMIPREKVEWNVSQLSASLKDMNKRAFSYADKRLTQNKKHLFEMRVVNNRDWHEPMTLLSFLSDVGRHFRVNSMIARDSVKSRIESQQGISYTEFTYQLLQAYDFYYLWDKGECAIQLGGADQWGNIVSGIDLIGRMRQEMRRDPTKERPKNVYGLTTPLLTTPSGQKFGKSEGNAIWLNPRFTSPLDFYQFFLNTSDDDIERFLKLFTLLPLSEIISTLNLHKTKPEARRAQKLLAAEITELIHGEAALERALLQTRILFQHELEGLDPEEVLDAFRLDQRLVKLDESEMLGKPIVQLAALHNLVSSKGDARRLAEAKGLYLNNQPVDFTAVLKAEDLLGHQLAFLRAGKDKHLILAVQ